MNIELMLIQPVAKLGEPGDVVSFQLPNWWQFVALHLGCVRAGAITNPLMPIFRERELRFMLGFAESKLFIAPRRFRGFDHAVQRPSNQNRMPACGLRSLGCTFDAGDVGGETRDGNPTR